MYYCCCRTKHFEFVPLTPLEESFEDNSTNSSPVQHTIDNSTASIPPLSIISDDHTLSSRDTNKTTAGTVTSKYNRPPAVIPSLVDSVLHNKFSRYLNGSFDSMLGYTTTDVTSDVDSVDHVKHPLVENKMMCGRVDNPVRVADKRIQLMTHKGTQLVTHKGTQCKETQKSTELDNLWQKFLTSPLYIDWVESDHNGGMCYCEELKQLEYKCRNCRKLSTKPQVTVHHEHSTCSGDSRTTLYTDTGTQTSPSLLRTTKSTQLTNCPCVSSCVIRGSPPSSDSSLSDQGSCDLTGSYEQPASLTKLSLQEACHMFKRDFISNCRHRQKMINLIKRQREEELLANRHQAALADLMRDHKTQYQNGEL